MSDEPPGIGDVLTSAEVTVRDLELTDREELLAMRREPAIVKWWGEPEPGWLFESPEIALTILVDDELAGFVELYESGDPNWYFATLDIFVRPDLIGKGHGTEALRLMVEYLAVRRKHHRITIDPAVDNEVAIASYTKVGFEPVGVMKKYWRDGDGRWRDSLLMELIIESNL